MSHATKKNVADERTSGLERKIVWSQWSSRGLCGVCVCVCVYIIYIYHYTVVRGGWACCAIQSKLLGMKLIVVLWFRAGNRCVRACARACLLWGRGGEDGVRALARLRDKLCALSKHNWKLSSRWSPDRVIRLSHKNRPPHLRRALKDRTPPRPADRPVPPATPTIQQPTSRRISLRHRGGANGMRRRSHNNMYYIILYRVCLAARLAFLQLITTRHNYNNTVPENNVCILFSVRAVWCDIKKIDDNDRRKFCGGGPITVDPHAPTAQMARLIFFFHIDIVLLPISIRYTCTIVVAVAL